MCSVAGFVMPGVGRVSGMCVAGRLLEVAATAGDLARLA